MNSNPISYEPGSTETFACTTRHNQFNHVIFQYDEEQEKKRERERKQKQLDGLEMQWQVRDCLALQLLVS